MESENINIDLDRKEEEPAEFVAFVSRIKRIAAIAGGIGGTAGLCFSIGYVMRAGNWGHRGVFVMPFVCGIGLSLMATGTALLFAPDAFFTCKTGREYMQAIGARSVFTARVAIGIALVLGCLAFGLFAMGALQMAGLIGSQGR